MEQWCSGHRIPGNKGQWSRRDGKKMRWALLLLWESTGFRTGREGPGKAQVSQSWGTELEFQGAHGAEYREGRAIERAHSGQLGRGGRGVSTHVHAYWEATQGWRKNHQKEWARTTPRIHTGPGIIVPVATAE